MGKPDFRRGLRLLALSALAYLLADWPSEGFSQGKRKQNADQ